MLRVNYRPSRADAPTHQRDFPRREQLYEVPGATGSRNLALMVAGYLVAMFGGIVLLGYLTAPTLPGTTTAAASSTLKK
jgi:hypothetical protein